MNKWDDYYDIEQEDIPIEDVEDHWYNYKLIVRSTKEVIGTYKDYGYAKKQAEYKFKRMMKNIERTLLGG